MKKNTAYDTPISHWEEHVRNNPQMYFPTRDVDELQVSNAIEESAKILGAKKTSFMQKDGWSYFCSDVDWIFKSKFPFESIRQIFSGPGAFPEAEEQHSFRYESLCFPFSSSVFAYSEKSIDLLKGALPPEDVLANHLSELGKWGRIIGFKFEKTHNKYEPIV